jgi:hypothetical protein
VQFDGLIAFALVTDMAVTFNPDQVMRGRVSVTELLDNLVRRQLLPVRFMRLAIQEKVNFVMVMWHWVVVSFVLKITGFDGHGGNPFGGGCIPE